jgi:hypothetical protein
MRHVLNGVFGLCGVGWGYDFAVHDLEVSFSEKSVTAVCRRLVLWFALKDGDEVRRCEVPATGASENRNPQYAMKGALTNALGNAVSNLGFQESVYLGRRSHVTVARPPATPAKSVAGETGVAPARPRNGHGVAPTIKKTGDKNAGDYVIAIGTQYKGKAVKELPPKVLCWFAESMAATTAEAQAAKQACATYLAAHPELRPATDGAAVPA